MKKIATVTPVTTEKTETPVQQTLMGKGGKKPAQPKPQTAPPKKGGKKKIASPGKKAVSYWTPKRVESLQRWFLKYRGQENVYGKITKRMTGTSVSAVYKKLGRLGLISAPWARRLTDKSHS